jgi:hypothetical protein
MELVAANNFNVSITYKPKLVHRTIDTTDATFEIRTNRIVFERKEPAYYVLQDSLDYLKNNFGTKTMANYINTTPLCTMQTFLFNTQVDMPCYQYEIGNTKMSFLFHYEKIINNQPYVDGGKIIGGNKIDYFPFHTTVGDAFLNDGSLRIFSKKGFIFLPFAPEKSFVLYRTCLVENSSEIYQG